MFTCTPVHEGHDAYVGVISLSWASWDGGSDVYSNNLGTIKAFPWDSEVKNTSCSCIGPDFSSYHPYGRYIIYNSSSKGSAVLF